MVEPHGSATVHITREQRRDVGTEVVVCRMSDRLPIHNHTDGGAIDWNYVGILGERPTKSQVRGAGCRVILAGGIDGAEWLSRMRIVHRDGLGAEVGYRAGFIVR